MNTIKIDTSNMAQLLELMNRHKEFTSALSATNQDGEKQLISINEHNVTIRTIQSNNWQRINVIYDDGTSEEYYER